MCAASSAVKVSGRFRGNGLQRIEVNTSAPRRGRTIGLAAAPRNITVALASAGVLALLVLYAIAAPTSSMTASFGPVVPRQSSKPVVLGRVLGSSGNGLKGARISVGREGRDPVASATSGPSGTFLVELPGGCAMYHITIEARAQGAKVRTQHRSRLCPGDALPVDARVKAQGHFLWVPGPR
jgi:hypothetical protein